MTTHPRLSLEGRQWGRYRIERLLGAGGMGIVYQAVHVDLNRAVALKILKPDLAHDPGLQERFRAESRAAASLNHPNLAVVHDVGEADGYYYFIMDLVEGEDLGTIIDREGRLPLAKALELAEQIARALDHAHTRGIIHRDIKPQNILIGRDGTVKVTDFGIARAFEGTRMTATGILVGTPEYLAPEQALGQPTDARSDIYALGIVLYEMLTGQVPFTAETPVAVALQQVNAAPAPPRSIVPSLPEDVEQIVLKALGKKPEDRFPSARVFAEALTRQRLALEVRSLTQEVVLPQRSGAVVVSAVPETFPQKIAARRLTVPAALAIVVLLAGVGAVAWSIVRDRPSRAVAPPPRDQSATATPAPGQGAAPPQSQSLLSLVLDSVPQGADVYLDGSRLGTTPLTRQVKPGVYAVEVRARGFIRWRERADMSSGSWKRTAQLMPLAPAEKLGPGRRTPDGSLPEPATPRPRVQPPTPGQSTPEPPQPTQSAPTPRATPVQGPTETPPRPPG